MRSGGIGRAPSPRFLAALAGLLLGFVVLHVATRSTDHRISLEARGSTFTLRIDGEELSRFESTRYASGRAGLYLRGADSGAWRDVTVRAADGRVLFERGFESGTAEGFQPLRSEWEVTSEGYETRSDAQSFALFGDAAWADYTVEATLSAGGNGGLLVRTDGANGVGCIVRFDSNAASIFMRSDGAWSAPQTEGRLHSPAGFRARKLALTGLGLAKTAVAWTLLIAVGFAFVRLAFGPRAEREAQRFAWMSEVALRRVVLAACVFSFAASAWVSWRWLGAIPHVEDGIAYLFQAKIFALGRIHVPVHPLPAFFEHFWFLVNDGHVSSFYEPGWPALLVPGLLLGSPWLVNPLLGAATLFFVYRIGAEVYDAKTGALAAALGAVSPFHVYLSASFLSQTSCAFAITLGVYAWLRAGQSRSLGWPLLAGIALSGAGLIRVWTTAALLLPFALVSVADLLGFFSARGLRRPAVERARAYGWMALGAVPAAAALLVYNHGITGSALTFPRELVAPGISPLANVLAGVMPAEGLKLGDRRLALLAAHLFGWPYASSLVFVIARFVLLSRHRFDYLLLAAVATHFSAYLFYDRDGTSFGPRFVYESVPFLLLLSSRGIFAVAELCGRARARVPVEPVVAALIAAAVAHAALYYAPPWLERFPTYWNVSTVVVDAVGELRSARSGDAPPALVFLDPATVEPLSGFLANGPRLDGPVLYARSLGVVRDRALALHHAEREVFLFENGALHPYAPIDPDATPRSRSAPRR